MFLKTKTIWIFLAFQLLLVGGISISIYFSNRPQTDTDVLPNTIIQRPPRMPAAFLPEDVLRPLDRDILEQFMKLDNTKVSKNIDSYLLKPFLDDVQTRSAKVNGLEVTETSFQEFPQLYDAIVDCGKILKMPLPRVYVADEPGLNAYTTNLADPIIVIHSSVVRRFTDPAELRFVIGHEMGHIYGHHVKLQTVLKLACKAMPEKLAAVAVLPLLKWSREAEMSADRVALICCQDIEVAEQALLRMLLNIPELTGGKFNIDAYLEQQDNGDLSEFSNITLWVQEVMNDHPFVPARINALRQYVNSAEYQHLWED